MLSIILIIIALVLFAWVFYKWATENNDFFAKRGIPQMRPAFLVGNNSGALLRKFTVPEFAMHLYSQFPNEKVFGFFDVRTPVYFIRDLELIKQLTIKDFDHFEDHLTFIDDKNDELFGNSLFLMKGEKWREMRSTLSPAFTGSKMRQMFGLVSECADDLVTYFMRKAKNGETINYEIKELFSRYANDVIASCAFGIKVNSMENSENEFYQIGRRSLDFSGARAVCKLLLMRMVPFLMKALKIEIVDQTVGKFFRTMVLDIMDFREKENIFRPDMINILMQFRNGHTKSGTGGTGEKPNSDDGFATVEEIYLERPHAKRQWSDKELVAQCFLFFLAGFETTSTLLTFITYELIVNPDVQQKLFEEIQDTNGKLKGDRIDYDTLQKMKYMDQVVTETLRKWPPQPNLDRVCSKDYTYADGESLTLTIDKGYAVNIPVYGIHHDAKYYPDPEKFDPERFSDENKANIVPGSFIPFGVGPRNCIGSRFALMETKAIIYNMVLNFSLEPNKQSQIPIVLKKNPFTLTADQGVNAELRPRHQLEK